MIEIHRIEPMGAVEARQGIQRVGSPPGPPYLETQTFGIVDRADAVATIQSLLLADGVRLLTLTGPAGVGKTRLALEVGRTLASHFADGVVFVDLTSVRNPNMVFEVLAQSLDAHHVPADTTLPARIEAALWDRAMLIVLDNAEQVLSGALQLTELLATIPRVTLLVTSREALHLRWERIFHVPPLALPDPEHLPPLADLSQIPSVALFLQRARAIDPDFALNQCNARAVAELCLRLDGLPLAIELAAVQTTIMSPQMLLDRLGRRLSLLRWRAQDIPGRQQTLGAAIAWSYDLLSPDEQTIFRHLGVFAGSFSLQAAEAIAGHLVNDPLGALASLVDKSLVRVQGRDLDNVRYVLLESMREYARERLLEAGEQDEAGRIHALYYVSLAERAEPELTGPERRIWLSGLESTHENLRAALRWLLEHDEGELALRLVTALGNYWVARGYRAEDMPDIDEALSRSSNADPRLRAKGLGWLGVLLIWSAGEVEGDERSREVERAKIVLGEALALARSLDERLTAARTQISLGMLALQSREWKEAKHWLEQAHSSYPELHYPRGVAYTLLYLGAVELMQGNRQEAARSAEESLALFRELDDDSGTGLALLVLMSATGAQRSASTGKPVQELFTPGNPASNRRLIALCAAGVVWLSRDHGDSERLARLVGAAETRHHVTEYAARVLFRVYVAAASETLQARMGKEAFAAALAEGRSLTLEHMTELVGEVLDDIGDSGASSASVPKPSQATILSPREQEVLQLVAQGLSDKQIAQQVIVSRSTVHYHMTSIFNKLGVDSRAHAVAVAAQRGLLLFGQA